MVSKALFKVLKDNDTTVQYKLEDFKKLKIQDIPWQDYTSLIVEEGWGKLVEKVLLCDTGGIQ